MITINQKMIRYVENKISRLPLEDDLSSTLQGVYNSLLTQKGRKEGKERYGCFVHILNYHVQESNIEKVLDEFSLIEGEVCVSEIGDEYLRNFKKRIGVVLEGPLEAFFPFDCCSVLQTDGTRIATRGHHGKMERTEGWMIPAKCKVIGIVADDIVPIRLKRYKRIKFSTLEGRKGTPSPAKKKSSKFFDSCKRASKMFKLFLELEYIEKEDGKSYSLDVIREDGKIAVAKVNYSVDENWVHYNKRLELHWESPEENPWLRAINWG